METNYKFPKAEKLCGDKAIDNLFANGSAFTRYPFRVTYLLRADEATADEAPLRMMVSVGKKRFKRAVKRNHVKRLAREAYRLGNHPLREALALRERRLHVAFVFVGKEMPDYEQVAKGMTQAIERLVTIVNRAEEEA